MQKLFLSLFISASLLAVQSVPNEEAGIVNVSELNSPDTEYTPFIMPDESRIFFQSNRAGSIGFSGNFDIWMSMNRSPETPLPAFDRPINLAPPINTPGFEGMPAVREIGFESWEIIFASTADDETQRTGSGETNLYRSLYRNGIWSAPEPLTEINTPFHDRMPTISVDGSMLYFSSNRPGSYGSDDIWFSRFDPVKQQWSEPVNAGSSINSVASEISPSLHTDGITLYFSSNRKGGVGSYDMYYTQNTAPTAYPQFKPAANLGIPFNSPQDDEYPSISRSGDLFYFSSNRKGGKGSFDIYRANVPHYAKPFVILTLKGFIREAGSDRGLESTIEITGAGHAYRISSKPASGEYSLQLHNNLLYKIIVSSPGFESQESYLDLRRNNVPGTVTRNFSLLRDSVVASSMEIVVFFENEKGELLQPNAVYQILPSSMTEKILPFQSKRGIIRLDNLPREKGQIHELLRLSRITLNASLPGYENVQYNNDLFEVFENSQGVLPIAEIHLLMESTASATEQKNKQKEIELEITPGGEILASFYFPHNIGNRLSNGSTDKVKTLVAMLKEKKEIILVQGHTDSTGSEKRNNTLSRSRAEYIRKLLIANGLPADKIKTEWFAARRPAVEEKDEAAKAKNRRVEIRLSKPQSNTTNQD